MPKLGKTVSRALADRQNSRFSTHNPSRAAAVSAKQVTFWMQQRPISAERSPNAISTGVWMDQ